MKKIFAIALNWNFFVRIPLTLQIKKKLGFLNCGTHGTKQKKRQKDSSIRNLKKWVLGKKIQYHYLKKKKVTIIRKKAQVVFLQRPFHLLLQCMEKMMSEGGSEAAPCLSTFWPGLRHTQSRFINLPHTIDVWFMGFKGLNALSWAHVPHVGLLIAALRGTQNTAVPC